MTPDDRRRQQRALKASGLGEHASDPGRRAQKGMGPGLLVASLILMLVAIGSGTGFLNFIGFVFAHAYVLAKTKSGDKSTDVGLAKASRVFFIIGAVLGAIIRH